MFNPEYAKGVIIIIIAMNVMIRGFHGGTSTAWVPLNRKVVDLLRMLTSEDRTAGVRSGQFSAFAERC